MLPQHTQPSLPLNQSLFFQAWIDRTLPMTKEPNNEHSTCEIETCFTCCKCGQIIPTSVPGSTHRNHCPKCLWSRHVDMQTGDRKSGCKSPMEPIGVSIQRNGEWSLVHRCHGCGMLRVNRIGSDDNEMLLLSFAVKPLSSPPFPLERINTCKGDEGVQPSQKAPA